SVYFDSEPWRFQWVSDDELEALEEAAQFPEQAPPSPEYMPGPEHPPSPDYVLGLEHPPSPDYVPCSEYPEYLVPSEDEEEDLEEDSEEDPAEYPADGRGDDDEEEEDNKEEKEHLALADSITLSVVDHVLFAEDTEEFKTDESAPTSPIPSPRL
ncbi:hypothetical protein Tco_0306523, partial [Tanacetum coccineum]